MYDADLRSDNFQNVLGSTGQHWCLYEQLVMYLGLRKNRSQLVGRGFRSRRSRVYGVGGLEGGGGVADASPLEAPSNAISARLVCSLTSFSRPRDTS